MQSFVSPFLARGSPAGNEWGARLAAIVVGRADRGCHGVAGAGRTTVGRGLARRLGWRFKDGDALHPPENVAKMRTGHPLDDDDRAPWRLTAMSAQTDAWRDAGIGAVVACSAGAIVATIAAALGPAAIASPAR